MKTIRTFATATLLSFTALPVLAGTMTLYKDPNCGCCAAHAEYLRENGFEVEIVETYDLASVNAEAGVPLGQQGCHTALIDGYAVSGHVPADILSRFLSEKPEAVGLSLPGMPMGAPGMGDDPEAELDVVMIDAEGMAMPYPAK
ncbi:DUF411 domain-containing protein (plasmid) [Limimaricola variabilis]|uniref:DUF411 domain-containing protein n=1 Tax=Limimaricola variabilis TaxID=1492771 RepID=UPI002AC911FE|nr:DUF411 domain-containing protein [Limimaricola variabilis]WPY96934.1 DUF411 domain-containing protein [Limimaricola variabilis]